MADREMNVMDKDHPNHDVTSNDLYFDRARKKTTISSEYIHKQQFKHFCIFNIAPHALLIALAAVLYFTDQLHITVVEVLPAIVLWAITGLGITVGYHRLYTHRSFKANRWVRILLHISGLMAGQGGLVSWAALHRMHHQKSDKPGDPHSPNLVGVGFRESVRGIAHSHFTWMMRHEYPNVLHYVPDLVKERDIAVIDKQYFRIFLIGLVIPALISGLYYQSIVAALNGLLIGGLLRVVVLGNTIWAINSFLHRFGSVMFHSKDKSHNSGILALFSFGEAWHNNHHAFPGSAAFGLKWYQVDFGYYLIKLLGIMHLAHDIKRPKEEHMARSYHEQV